MHESLKLVLCEMQAQLFVMSKENNFDSKTFIKTFMNSTIAKALDSRFDHTQWAGEAYNFSRFKEEYANALKQGEVYDTETLYWTGYIYRYWHFYTGETSREIYKQANA